MLILLLLLALVLIPHTAHAYIDPGSGSLILQSLIALVVGGWLTLRVFASNFFRKLRGKRKTPDQSADETPDARDDASAR